MVYDSLKYYIKGIVSSSSSLNNSSTPSDGGFHGMFRRYWGWDGDGQIYCILTTWVPQMAMSLPRDECDMTSSESPPPIPFENTTDQPDPVWETLVKENLGRLKGGIDGFYDTIDKHENEGQFTEEKTASLCTDMLGQIEEACATLVSLDISLPLDYTQIWYDESTARPNEVLYELGRWVYNIYNQEFKWAALA